MGGTRELTALKGFGGGGIRGTEKRVGKMNCGGGEPEGLKESAHGVEGLPLSVGLKKLNGPGDFGGSPTDDGEAGINGEAGEEQIESFVFVGKAEGPGPVAATDLKGLEGRVRRSVGEGTGGGGGEVENFDRKAVGVFRLSPETVIELDNGESLDHGQFLKNRRLLGKRGHGQRGKGV
jgi:hypothetical protein